MGKTLSKSKKKNNRQIINYNNVSIPEGYALLKICGFNIDIKNTININNTIKDIIAYILIDYNKKYSDIICLQGIHDYSAAKLLIQEIKKYTTTNYFSYFFAPEFNEIHVESPFSSKNKSTNLTINKAYFSSTFKNNIKKIDEKKNSEFHNIIISKYQILSSVFNSIDDNDDDMKTIIGANILINNSIISIYCTELSKDDENINKNNSIKRQLQFSKIKDVIRYNINILSMSDSMDQYVKSDIHIIVGSFYINMNMDNIDDLDEYATLSDKYKFMDIYRILHNGETSDKTNIRNRTDDMMLIYLTPDLYNENGKYYDFIQNISCYNDVKTLIMNRYNVHFVESYVREDMQVFSFTNYPIETIFMLKIIKN